MVVDHAEHPTVLTKPLAISPRLQRRGAVRSNSASSFSSNLSSSKTATVPDDGGRRARRSSDDPFELFPRAIPPRSSLDLSDGAYSGHSSTHVEVHCDQDDPSIPPPRSAAQERLPILDRPVGWEDHSDIPPINQTIPGGYMEAEIRPLPPSSISSLSIPTPTLALQTATPITPTVPGFPFLPPSPDPWRTEQGGVRALLKSVGRRLSSGSSDFDMEMEIETPEAQRVRIAHERMSRELAQKRKERRRSSDGVDQAGVSGPDTADAATHVQHDVGEVIGLSSPSNWEMELRGIEAEKAIQKLKEDARRSREFTEWERQQKSDTVRQAWSSSGSIPTLSSLRRLSSG